MTDREIAHARIAELEAEAEMLVEIINDMIGSDEVVEYYRTCPMQAMSMR